MRPMDQSLFSTFIYHCLMSKLLNLTVGIYSSPTLLSRQKVEMSKTETPIKRKNMVHAVCFLVVRKINGRLIFLRNSSIRLGILEASWYLPNYYFCSQSVESIINCDLRTSFSGLQLTE